MSVPIPRYGPAAPAEVTPVPQYIPGTDWQGEESIRETPVVHPIGFFTPQVCNGCGRAICGCKKCHQTWCNCPDRDKGFTMSGSGPFLYPETWEEEEK